MFILILLTKNYVAIAALCANVTNDLYCVHDSVALLHHYREACRPIARTGG